MLDCQSIRLQLVMLLAGLLFTSSAILAGEVSQVTPVSIGTVDLHPAGDAVVIAAENGSTVPVSGRSLVTGGGSGLIILTSTLAEHVDITYPLSATLSNGAHTITVIDISSHSEYNATGVDLPGGGISVEVSIGGKIILPADVVYGSYNGTMSVQLNFF